MDKNVLSFLSWIRDHEHHYAAWHPTYVPPDQSTHLLLCGDGVSKKTAVSTFERARPFCQSGYASKSNRMYEPNEAGLKLLQEASI